LRSTRRFSRSRHLPHTVVFFVLSCFAHVSVLTDARVCSWGGARTFEHDHVPPVLTGVCACELARSRACAGCVRACPSQTSAFGGVGGGGGGGGQHPPPFGSPRPSATVRPSREPHPSREPRPSREPSPTPGPPACSTTDAPAEGCTAVACDAATARVVEVTACQAEVVSAAAAADAAVVVAQAAYDAALAARDAAAAALAAAPIRRKSALAAALATANHALHAARHALGHAQRAAAAAALAVTQAADAVQAATDALPTGAHAWVARVCYMRFRAWGEMGEGGRWAQLGPPHPMRHVMCVCVPVFCVPVYLCEPLALPEVTSV
jgi:hypothetical protein